MSNDNMEAADLAVLILSIHSLYFGAKVALSPTVSSNINLLPKAKAKKT